jgi:hypothetical protein
MSDFEKGKQLVIEGVEEITKLYFPYLKVIEGLRLLGLSVIVKGKRDEDKLIKIGLDSLVGGLKRATSKEEVSEVIQQNDVFWKMVSGQEDSNR